MLMERYSIITDKNPREIVLLRGRGCVWQRCPFCDYHTDSCQNEAENFDLNRQVLANVIGKYADLEVINSGSVFELDRPTLELIRQITRERGIKTLHFESHYLYREKIPALREYYSPVELKMKLGLETFDFDFRENVLRKGIDERDPAKIAEHFDEANFLFGLTGQTAESMLEDIRLGLSHFSRICVNIMCENTTQIKPDPAIIAEFMGKVYPIYRDNPRVDILVNNTDFGVGD